MQHCPIKFTVDVLTRRSNKVEADVYGTPAGRVRFVPRRNAPDVLIDADLCCLLVLGVCENFACLSVCFC